MADPKTPSQPLGLGMHDTDRPLDALFPELAHARSLPKEAVHPRVLEDDDAWVLACWQEPASTKALHTAVRNLLEATFLFELCQPARKAAAVAKRRASVRMIFFRPVHADVRRALQAFAFEEADLHDPRYAESIALLRNEGEQAGHYLPPSPHALWRAPVQQPSGAWGERVAAVEERLRQQLPDETFGERPGMLSHQLSNALADLFGVKIPPSLEGLRQMELLLVPREEGAIRWLHPLVFQALCDFIGVLLTYDRKRDVSWGLCEEEEGGFIPPPVLRIGQPPDAQHLNIGLHILRWCVMPILPGEQVPALADWIQDEFPLRR